MIFLGAGASKTFGIKTLKEMSNDLFQIIRERGFSSIAEKIVSSLQRYGIEPDFEAVFTIIEGLADTEKAVRSSTPLMAYVSRDLKDIERIDKSSELGQVLRDFLYNECKLKPELKTLIEPTYDKLFDVLKHSGTPDMRYWTTEMGDVKAFEVGTWQTIITTNYDMVVESYFRTKRSRAEPIADGFEVVQGDHTLKQQDFSTYKKSAQWLVKLHGSIYEFREKDGIFKSTDDPQGREIPVRIIEKMMIYPTGEKEILKCPYYNYYNIFKSQKWQKLVSIGYSFRDDPVNTAIVENLEQVHTSNLIVVNPKPEEVIQNMITSVSSDLEERIIPIKGKFGDEEVFERLRCAIVSQSKSQYNRIWGRQQ